jgi:hypothetical protein
MFIKDNRSNKHRPMKSPGPYEAIVTSHLDSKYSGTLEVELLKSNESGNSSVASSQRVQVRYLNPFYGVTSYNGVTRNHDYASSQQSYGMWFIPPDVGNTVLVIFVEGNINKGYWFGCVQAENQNFMLPDGRAATTFTDTTNNLNSIGKKLPVGEYNKELLTNLKNLTDATKNLKPINQDFVNVLNFQGLLEDEIRGLTTSSARREVPSSVFGVSTPGPLDKRGNSRGKGGRYYSRLGGSSIVMDDGDDKFVRKTSAATGPSEYVNQFLDIAGITEGNETIPHNELLRIRTRTGHQILLHNSEDLIYIGNAKGTTWIEMTANGKLDIFAQDSVSIHTQTDFNFKADRDVNIEAGRNINIKGRSNINMESMANYNLKVGAGQNIVVGSVTNIYSGSNINMDSGTQINMMNGLATAQSAQSISTHNNPGESYGNIMKRVPQHEPWSQHENLNPTKVSTGKTDANTIEPIEGTALSSIPDTFKKGII